ncbi:CDP-glycerol glycerophosphotransferase family protein [Fictibacillus fluitans]|uniref:CDP-glycerol glycerophosphotransferase family protein n=1 Tax=Fictibacillus fluitans TaxID=3058422 RepID=A0ABT8I118_9BACL|nr:CDP-glycerol glycerophosphotransferase family protein [Fictibacillus sp. NE201]MDN4526724.1 CDP-glycerol glycerophosphotransferase family protein [Fictibacillus sp. NE201]
MQIVALFKKYVALLFIHLFNFLPIQNNKIFCFSYYGSQYGCNPKYITEYIRAHYPDGYFDIVWAFNNPKSKQQLTGFRKVNTMSLRCFYELCTSKVIITNYRTTDLFVKRKEQYYVQTWHSSLRLKQIEMDAIDSLPDQYIQMAQRDSEKCDLLLSGCESSSFIFKRSFWYEGAMFEHGTPRNDVFFNSSLMIKDSIKKTIGIPVDARIVLYAPTFRKNNDIEIYHLPFDTILKSLKERFGGNWVCLVKLHPHLMGESNKLHFSSNVKDVTYYDDIQELLAASDVLISDYSSLLFDFSITSRPCFQYIPDVESYIKNDRKLYFDIQQLPFLKAKTHPELLEKIDSYKKEEYERSLAEFLSKIGTFENGNACKKLVDHLHKICFEQKGSSYHEAV